MRFSPCSVILLILSVTLLSCRSVIPEQQWLPQDIKKSSFEEEPEIRTAVPAVPEKTRPAAPARSPRVGNRVINGISFSGVEYDSRTHRLAVVDQNGGPGSRYSSARDVVSKNGALLAINAGFFTPEGKPLGLVVSEGKRSGAWNSASSLGNGIYRVDPSGNPSVSRRRNQNSVSSSEELLQSGPLLIENGSAVRGLSKEKQAVRSIVLTDGHHRWWVGRSSTCDLARLADALAGSSPANWKIAMALNLDGGRSSDLYISRQIQGGPLEFRSFFNRPVRNFLVLKKR